jgi:hypothetical protein
MSIGKLLKNNQYRIRMVHFSVNPSVVQIWGSSEVTEINRSLDRRGNLRVPFSVKTDIRNQLEPLISKLFEELQEVLNRLSSIADDIISKSEAMAKDLIKIFFDDLNRIITDIEKKIEALWVFLPKEKLSF